MQLIGLTGGIATGKSTCSTYLQEQGIPIIDADIIARDILRPGTFAYKKVCKTFPQVVDAETDELNRTALGDIIFKDTSAKKKLERITHPWVKWNIFKKCAIYWVLGYDRVILDIPLLFETGLNKFMSYTVVVCADEHVQIERLKKRNGLAQGQAESRIAGQMNLEKKCKLADVLVDNRVDLQHLYQQLDIKLIMQRPSWFYHRFLLHALPMAGLFGILVHAISCLLNL